MVWPFRKRSRKPEEPPLLWLGKDRITMRDLYEGVWISGSIGGGKTSGPAEAVCRALLEHESRPAFLVLTAKPGEGERWKRLCEQTGRARDLVIWGPGSGLTCDLLGYEMSQPQGSAQAGAAMVAAVMRLASRQSQGGGGENVFFEKTAERMTRSMIETIHFGTGSVSFADCYRFLTSAPNTLKERDDPEWREKSYCFQCVRAMGERAADLPASAVALNGETWLKEWPSLADKTRSIIHTMISTTIDYFLSSASADLISSGETNFPIGEFLSDGGVCVNGMDYLRYREPGRFFQIAAKMTVQRYALRRDVTPDLRPIVIVQDEAQLFVTDFDVECQTVARESRLVTMFITQSLPVLYEALGGGPKAEQQAQALVANLQNKYLCQSSCHTSNQVWSTMIGESLHHFMSGSMPTGSFDLFSDLCGLDQEDRKGSIGFNSQMRAEVLPSEFTKLKKGGPAHNNIVEAICFMGGKRFASNGNKAWMKVEFQQKR